MDILEPIQQQIRRWINYEKGLPKTTYEVDRKSHDDYRSHHDLDCLLLQGDLHADMLISLWLPLRGVLVSLNGYQRLNNLGKVEKAYFFLEKLSENLSVYLPVENRTVSLLSHLFELGQKRCNVMRLPERWMQSRGGAPYYDYMPCFLAECFSGGDFSRAFENDEALINWIKQERLQVFFKEACISKDNILDLTGKGLGCNIPNDWSVLLEKYIFILEKREKLLGND